MWMYNLHVTLEVNCDIWLQKRHTQLTQWRNATSPTPAKADRGIKGVIYELEARSANWSFDRAVSSAACKFCNRPAEQASRKDPLF